jgi:branched-chain amino acid transport system substrate-binding protein
MGQQIREAVELAVGEWNTRGGLAGRPILVMTADDRQDPKGAVEAARRLVHEGVMGVVGHVGTETTLAAAAVYAAAGVLQVAPAATNPRLTQDGIPTLFRLCGRDDDQGRVAAAFAAGELRARRAAVLHDGTDYGAGVAAAFREAFGRRVRGGIVLVGEVPPGEREMEGLTARFRDVEADVHFFAGLAGRAAQLRRAAWQAGLRVPFLGGDAAVDPQFVRTVGEAAAAEAYFTFAPDVRTLPTAQAFWLMHSRLVGPPGPYSVYGYDAAGALLRALARAALGGRWDAASAARALRARPYEGALGRLHWDARGDLAVPLYVVYRTERGGPLQGWFAPVTSLSPDQPPRRGRTRSPESEGGRSRILHSEPHLALLPGIGAP